MNELVAMLAEEDWGKRGEAVDAFIGLTDEGRAEIVDALTVAPSAYPPRALTAITSAMFRPQAPFKPEGEAWRDRALRLIEANDPARVGAGFALLRALGAPASAKDALDCRAREAISRWRAPSEAFEHLVDHGGPGLEALLSPLLSDETGIPGGRVCGLAFNALTSGRVGDAARVVADAWRAGGLAPALKHRAQSFLEQNGVFVETSETSFFRAIDLGNIEHVRACLDSGIQADTADEEGVSALHHAVRAWVDGVSTTASALVVELLAKAGANPRKKLRRDWQEDADEEPLAMRGDTPVSMVLDELDWLRRVGAGDRGEERRDAAHAERILGALGLTETTARRPAKAKTART